MNTTRITDRDPVAPSRRPPHRSRPLFSNVSAPVLWGSSWGDPGASAAAFWWLPRATVYARGLVLIASVYIGFSVADGRWKVIAIESGVSVVVYVVYVVYVVLKRRGWL